MGLFDAILGAFAGGNDEGDSSSEYFETGVCPKCGGEMHRRYSYSDWYCPTCGGPDDDEENEGEDDGEALDVYEAADIWMSNGMDEDYTFGYTEDELQRAYDEGPSW